MPVPISAEFTDNTSQLKWTERYRKVSTLKFISSAPLKDIQIDPAAGLALCKEPPSQKEIELNKAREL